VGVIGTVTDNRYNLSNESPFFQEPFRWTEETGLVRVGLLPGHRSNTPWAISADASVIAGNTSSTGNKNFLWDDVHGMQDLQAVLRTEHGLTPFTGWGIVNVLGMSADARTLVGSVNRTSQNVGTRDYQAFALFLDRPVHIRLSELPSGDYNANALVEQGDLDLVLLNWGTELLDPNGAGWIHDAPSGPIGQSELDAVLLNWGKTPERSAAAALASGVPEPTAAALAVVGIMGAVLSARRSRRGIPRDPRHAVEVGVVARQVDETVTLHRSNG
jgi:hypothetical protein